MKVITSRTNQTVKLVYSLHSKKGRDSHGQFIAEGVRTITTMLSHDLDLIQLYITENSPISIKCSQELVTHVTPDVMQKMSSSKNPCGYLALFAIPEKPQSPITHGIVLANITDPGNMGTLIRTAAAVNTKTVVIIDGVDPWSPKVIQASAGTIAAVVVHQLSWQELIIAKKEMPLYALVVKDGKKPQNITDHNALLVIGSEAHGIPREWLTDCTALITIPMPGGTESLNAAVAGSIALYLMALNSLHT